MDDLLLELSNGLQIAVPPSLAEISTYVLLEQEQWFEKELPFLEQLLAPGQTAIDIGASLGIFSLALAQRVGSTGRVFAYEPTSQARARLEHSRSLNGFNHLTVLSQALSDQPRAGWLSLGPASEFNRLGAAEDGPSESVEVSTLDQEAERHGWSRPDFIKISAGGEELAILDGATRLLDEAAPLLLLKFKDPDLLNQVLRPALDYLGYRTYRLLPGAPVLVPLEADVDSFELGIFAAKAERVADLATRGLLVESLPQVSVTTEDGDRALERLRAQPFAAAFAPAFAADVPVHPLYREALAAYDLWRDAARPMAERVGALDLACRTLGSLIQSKAETAWLLTFARISAEYGARAWVTRALDPVVQAARGGSIPMHEPFWPASPRYDDLPTSPQPAQWLLAGVFEAIEKQGRLTTLFGPPSVGLDWLCDSPYRTAEMQRRRALCQVRMGKPIVVPAALSLPSSEHRNSSHWENGSVARLAKALLDTLKDQAKR